MSCCQPRFVNGCEWGALCGQPKITHGINTAQPLSPGPLLLAETQTCEKAAGKGLRVEVRSEEEVEEWIPLAVCWCSCAHPASLRVLGAQFSWQGGSSRFWHVSSSCVLG